MRNVRGRRTSETTLLPTSGDAQSNTNTSVSKPSNAGNTNQGPRKFNGQGNRSTYTGNQQQQYLPWSYYGDFIDSGDAIYRDTSLVSATWLKVSGQIQTTSNMRKRMMLMRIRTRAISGLGTTSPTIGLEKSECHGVRLQQVLEVNGSHG